MKFYWPIVRDFLLIVIGVALVIGLRSLDTHIQEATATQCRVLVMFKQPIDPDGPCARDSVMQHYEDLEIVPIDAVVNDILEEQLNG